MSDFRIDVWSDIACPWCYVGKRRLEAALASFEHRDEVEVFWRAFELDPSAPRERDRGESYAERLARKYGTSPREADAMIARMTAVAAKDGLDFRFDRIRPGNTFDAHRVIHLGRDRGAEDAMKERLMRAYLTEGEPIGDPETLVRVASEVGLDAAEVRAALASDAHARAVREDEDEAAAMGVHGVPFFLLGGTHAVSGAQPAEVLVGAIRRAFRERPSPPSADEAFACGPSGCM